MANYNHHITYKLGGYGPLLERTIVASSNTEAEAILLSEEPTARVEKVLTTVPSKG